MCVSLCVCDCVCIIYTTRCLYPHSRRRFVVLIIVIIIVPKTKSVFCLCPAWGGDRVSEGRGMASPNVATFKFNSRQLLLLSKAQHRTDTFALPRTLSEKLAVEVNSNCSKTNTQNTNKLCVKVHFWRNFHLALALNSRERARERKNFLQFGQLICVAFSRKSKTLLKQ